MAHMIAQLPHSTNCLAGVLCFVESTQFIAQNALTGSSNTNNPVFIAVAQMIAAMLVSALAR